MKVAEAGRNLCCTRRIKPETKDAAAVFKRSCMFVALDASGGHFEAFKCCSPLQENTEFQPTKQFSETNHGYLISLQPQNKETSCCSLGVKPKTQHVAATKPSLTLFLLNLFSSSSLPSCKLGCLKYPLAQHRNVFIR